MSGTVVRYAVVLTRIRPEPGRDERVAPESVICRCEFEDRKVAERTAVAWAATSPVRAGCERVKVIAVSDGLSRHQGRGRPIGLGYGIMPDSLTARASGSSNSTSRSGSASTS